MFLCPLEASVVFLASSVYFPQPAGGPCDSFVPVEGNENGKPLAALVLHALEADRHVNLQRAMKGVACGILHPAERLDTLVSPAGFLIFRGLYSVLIHKPLEIRVKVLFRWRSMRMATLWRDRQCYPAGAIRPAALLRLAAHSLWGASLRALFSRWREAIEIILHRRARQGLQSLAFCPLDQDSSKQQQLDPGSKLREQKSC